MKKRHIIFLLLIVIGLVSIIFSITYALTTSVSENTSSDYDLSYIFTISDDTWTVTVEPSKTKVYEIALTNPYSDSIRYGVAYKINNSDISLEDISISTTKDSESLSEDLIGSNELKTVSVMIENNSTSSIEVNLIIVNGYKNGGDLIIPEGYSLVEGYNYALLTLTNLGLSVSEGTPDFSKTSCTSGCGESTVGIYKEKDNLGTSYYFRGAVTNNYVYFAGFYWRIIRINGDGTVRMIYDGTEAHANGESSTDRGINKNYFNIDYNDNSYLGYMYGTVGSSTYEETHINTNNSTIKDAVDTWYEENIKDTDYEEYLADAIYCNDREVYSGTGIGTTTTNYSAYNRLYANKIPTLVCTSNNNNNDKFTVSETLGNGDLTYPIGLITADEVVMAGGAYGTSNSNYYLYMGSSYWTMTPYEFNYTANGFYHYYNGSLSYVFVGNMSGVAVTGYNYVKPVISLKADVLNVGSGSSTDPFKVDIAKTTLTNLELTSNGTKDSFTTVATTDEGVFEAEDNLGTSYYFRGAVTNNYVKFAGYYWRIIRINGDGSIRMIYDGTSAHANGESNSDRLLHNSTVFNTSFNDNAYVGYMYGTTGSSTYESTHTNANDSTIKDTVDTWYETYIKDTEYEDYLVDAIYCNDREVYSGTGIGTTTTNYSAYNRLVTNKMPTLVCTSNNNNNDKFTVSETLGNGDLTYPIGLITADELVMAGGAYGTSNSNYYLYTGSSYWTMTPSFISGGSAYLFYNFSSINIDYVSVKNIYGVRSVISISPTAIKYGNGISANPFRLTEDI